MVGLSGLEPPTSRLSGARSNQLSYKPMAALSSSPFGLRRGGDDGIRTHDPLLAGQVLSQLSYTPIWGFDPSKPNNDYTLSSSVSRFTKKFFSIERR